MTSSLTFQGTLTVQLTPSIEGKQIIADPEELQTVFTRSEVCVTSTAEIDPTEVKYESKKKMQESTKVKKESKTFKQEPSQVKQEPTHLKVEAIVVPGGHCNARKQVEESHEFHFLDFLVSPFKVFGNMLLKSLGMSQHMRKSIMLPTRKHMRGLSSRVSEGFPKSKRDRSPRICFKRIGRERCYREQNRFKSMIAKHAKRCITSLYNHPGKQFQFHAKTACCRFLQRYFGVSVKAQSQAVWQTAQANYLEKNMHEANGKASFTSDEVDKKLYVINLC